MSAPFAQANDGGVAAWDLMGRVCGMHGACKAQNAAGYSRPLPPVERILNTMRADALAADRRARSKSASTAARAAAVLQETTAFALCVTSHVLDARGVGAPEWKRHAVNATRRWRAQACELSPRVCAEQCDGADRSAANCKHLRPT